MEYPFSVIGPIFTLTRSGSTWQGSINRANRTIWYLNSVQTNDMQWIKLLEIELFDHFSVCKQMTDL